MGSFQCPPKLRLKWNGASIATTTLHFMVILNMLDYISKPLMDKMDGQIIFTSKDVLKVWQVPNVTQCNNATWSIPNDNWNSLLHHLEANIMDNKFP